MNIDTLRASVKYIRGILPSETPAIAVVLGSGWSGTIQELEIALTIPYGEIPVLGATSVKGHSGFVKLASLNKRYALIFEGRRHWYEGAGWEPVIFPSFLSAELGISSILLTNAAGGINPVFKPGDLMIIDDHINMMGISPLIGCYPALSKTQFPDQTRVYNDSIKQLLEQSAKETGISIKHGVYLAVSGPTYETPAEVKAFRTMGADAAGMSTVPEAIVANALGLQTGAISCITNLASGVSDTPLSHDEVIAATSRAMPRISALLLNFLNKTDKL